MRNLFRKIPKTFRNKLLKQRLIKSFSLSQDIEPREEMNYDVAIIGGGPAGLSCAIKLKQLNEVY